MDYVTLHNEAKYWLLEVVNGEVNAEKPKQIVDPQASCKIAKVIHNLSLMLAEFNKKESK